MNLCHFLAFLIAPLWHYILLRLRNKYGTCVAALRDNMRFHALHKGNTNPSSILFP